MAEKKGWANIINKKANSLLVAGAVGASALTGCGDQKAAEEINGLRAELDRQQAEKKREERFKAELDEEMKVAHQEQQRKQSVTDVVNLQNSNAVASREVHLQWPDALVSTPEKSIDITDAKQVAAAMGVTLTGDPKQVLFNISINSRESGDEHFLLKVEEVTVENLAEKARFINSFEDATVSDATRAAMARLSNTKTNANYR